MNEDQIFNILQRGYYSEPDTTDEEWDDFRKHMGKEFAKTERQLRRAARALMECL